MLLFDNVLSRHHPRSVVFLFNFIVAQAFSGLKHIEEFWLICETCEVQKCLGIIAVGYETVRTLDVCFHFHYLLKVLQVQKSHSLSEPSQTQVESQGFLTDLTNQSEQCCILMYFLCTCMNTKICGFLGGEIEITVMSVRRLTNHISLKLEKQFLPDVFIHY